MILFIATFETEFSHGDASHWRDPLEIKAATLDLAIDLLNEIVGCTALNQTDHFAWLRAGGTKSTKRVLITESEAHKHILAET